ncbi:MAG: WbqC family protein [Bacteroidia bacterium]|nr:WbqC family protein [Bacteroidia bacterium]MCZ2249137.1 WbqC family protein [Bacteroidia bacterium]
MIVAIHQPNYLPWAGYFHKISKADCFVILDDVQIPGKGIHHRNFIKGKDGRAVLLSVPLHKRNGMYSTYNNVVPDYSSKWQRNHLNKIKDAYYKSLFFENIFTVIEQIILKKHENLTALNTELIQAICKIIQIKTPMVYASQYELGELKGNDKNIALCKQLHATTYLSGQGGKKYNDENMFKHHGIELNYQLFNLSYHQQGKNFIPNLSVIDLLFNMAPEEIHKTFEAI